MCAHLAAWVLRAGLDFVQLLPINDMDEAHNSPYSARSAMAIDPLFIALERPARLRGCWRRGGALAGSRRTRSRWHAASQRLTTAPCGLRRRPRCALAFRHSTVARRATTLRAPMRSTRSWPARRWWLDDYALFRALHDEQRRPLLAGMGAGASEIGRSTALGQRAGAARRRHPLSRVRAVGRRRTMEPRADARARRSGSSAICRSWSAATAPTSGRVRTSFDTTPRSACRRIRRRRTGQDWGLPAHRWDVSGAHGYAWLRQRAERCAALFDGFRVDHVAGFYRTCVRERNGGGASRRRLKPTSGSRAKRSCGSSRAWAPDHRRGSRHRSRLRPRIDSGSWNAGIEGAALGAAVGRTARSRFAIRRRIRLFRSRRPAPTTPRPSRAGGTPPTWRNGDSAPGRRPCRRAGLRPDAPFGPSVRDALLRGVVWRRLGFRHPSDPGRLWLAHCASTIPRLRRPPTGRGDCHGRPKT